MDKYDTLTNRQKEVLELMAYGYSLKQIAEKLTLSVNTINTHEVYIYKNLGIKISELSRKQQAITIYWQHNIEKLREFEIR